jgi:hypothetical protein
MGSSAGGWMAALGREGSGVRTLAEAPARALGGIDVLVWSDGEWIAAGEFQETGPLATDVRVVPLPARAREPVRIRLRLTRGMWKVDGVQLAVLGDVVVPKRVRPGRVLRQGTPDAQALGALLDPARVVTTLPGDTLALVYALPFEAGRAELFLESRGYYIEWMRDEWLSEEDPARLGRLFMDPRGALREMAPAYKREEPALEAAFWGSRYAH